MFETKDKRKINIEKLSVDDTISLLNTLLPELAKIMESCNINNFSFYKATYPFGSPIINNGKCYLPLSNGESIEFNDQNMPDDLAIDLNYDIETEEPLSIILTKNSEFYMPNGNTTMPITIVNPGTILGIPKAVSPDVDSSLGWNMNAGVRHLIPLSRVTSRAMHSKLQKNHGVTLDVPLSVAEQWAVFVEIAKYAKSTWACEVLYFPRKLIKLLNDSSFVKLSENLLQIRRKSYNVWHNSALSWDTSFNTIEHAKRLLHYSSYALSTAKQLYIIGAKSAPGFRPATDDDSAPISLFNDIYANGYGLASENHSSIIMETASYNLNERKPVYYSVNYPTLARHNPDTFKGKSLISLMDDVEHITTACQEYIPELQPKIKSLHDVAVLTKFSFYHSHGDNDSYKNILNTDLIALEDERFTRNQYGEFAAHSQFFKGCIKIAPK